MCNVSQMHIPATAINSNTLGDFVSEFVNGFNHFVTIKWTIYISLHYGMAISCCPV